MKVALIQMEVVAGDVAVNRANGLRMAHEAAKQADVVILPEIWTTGYALRNVEEQAENEHGPTLTGLKEIAQTYQTTIISGSIPFCTDEKIFNSAFVINPAGELIACYHKIHLFQFMGEERFFAPGMERCTFPLHGTTAGLAICYDLRFPELFRSLTMDGATMIFLPAEWPAARGEHWRTLVQARAIENQVYLCAVNCAGQHRSHAFYGHSLLVGPGGDIIAEGGAGEEILYGEIDPGQVGAIRQNMPVWKDRRPALYR